MSLAKVDWAPNYSFRAFKLQMIASNGGGLQPRSVGLQLATNERASPFLVVLLLVVVSYGFYTHYLKPDWSKPG